MTAGRPPLGPITLLALGINGIVGVGIFLSPPIVARAFPGAFGAVVYVLVAIACLPIALVYARLSRALPADGGPALYAEKAFGPIVAHAVGGLVWVSALFSAAAVTRALSERVAALTMQPRFVAMIAVGIALGLALINLRNLRASAWMWTALTVAKLVPLVALATLGLFAAPTTTTGTGTHRGAALLAILFSLQGFEIVPLPAGQARDPEKNVPRATVGALIAAGMLYGVIYVACTRALPNLASSESAIPDAAAALGGANLSRAIGAGVMASMGGIVVGMHAMTPRYLSAITAERGATVPRRSIAVTALLITALCALSSLPELLNLASISVLAQYATTSFALVVLARRRAAGLLPIELWPAPFALAVVAVLLAQATAREVGVAAAFAAIGIITARVLTPRPSGLPPANG